MNIPYKAINVLLEATEKCNLRCRYCYHADDGYDSPNMSEDIFEKICSLTFPHYEQIQFLWHGGEPLCAGLSFHEKVLEIQRSYERRYPAVKVVNALQTNATLMNKEYAKFFSDNKFSVGISFDGIDNEVSRGRTDKVLSGIQLLKDAGIKNIGVITVVSGVNIGHIEDDYALMKKMNLSTDYNSLIHTGGACHNADVNLELLDYCESMNKFFDNWLFDKECQIVINPFHSYIRDIVLGTTSVCWHTSCLGRWINVKPDGTVFPCSREYPKEYSFGRIQEIERISDLFNSDAFGRLVNESVIRRGKCEKECKWYQYCQGGCSCTALTEGTITDNGGFTCEAFKVVFAHCFDAVIQVREKGKDYILQNINPMVANVLANGL